MSVNIDDRIERVRGGAVGVVYTISRLLGGSSTLSLAAGTNANLSLVGTTIVAAAAIPAGTSQEAIVFEETPRRGVKYAVAITAPATTPTPTPTAMSFGSAGLSFPYNFSAAVIAGDEYGYWAKRIYVTEDLPSGAFFFMDRAYIGSTGGTAIQKGTTEKQFLRVELVNFVTGAVTPTTHPVNGNPVADGNPVVMTAGGMTFVRHGFIARGVYDLDTYDYCPIGGKRTVHQNHEFANMAGDRYKKSAAPFHATAGRPTGTGTIEFYPKATAAMHWAAGRRKSVIGLGDSNEDQNNTFNGGFSQGPMRSVLTDPAIGSGSVINLGMYRASSGPTAVHGVGANGNQSILEMLEEAGTLIGHTEKWPFTDIVWQHFRNGVLGIIQTTKDMLVKVRAKDPAVRLWPVVPYPYTKGSAGIGAGNQTPPADLFASVAGQTAIDPDGTTTRDAYIAWLRSGGEGLVAGLFDDEIDLAPPGNPQLWNIGPAQKVKLATVDDAATGPQTIDLDFRPLQADDIVLDPGLASQELIGIHNTIAPVDLGGGIWRCRLSGSSRVTKQHAVDAVAQVVLIRDGTHGNARRQKMRRDSARNAATKNALIAA